MGFVRVIGSALIRDINTGDMHEIDSSDFQVSMDGGRSRTDGTEKIWFARIDHDDLGSLKWSVAEYPPGILNRSGIRADVNGHKVYQPIRFSFVNVDSSQIDETTALSQIQSIVEASNRSLAISTDKEVDAFEQISNRLRLRYPDTKLEFIHAAAEEIEAVYGDGFTLKTKGEMSPDDPRLQAWEQTSVPAQDPGGATFGVSGRSKIIQQPLQLPDHSWSARGRIYRTEALQLAANIQPKIETRSNMFPTMIRRLDELAMGLEKETVSPILIETAATLLKSSIDEIDVNEAHFDGPALEEDLSKSLRELLTTVALAVTSEPLEITSESGLDEELSDTERAEQSDKLVKLIAELLPTLEQLNDQVDASVPMLLRTLAKVEENAPVSRKKPSFLKRTVGNLFKAMGYLCSGVATTIIASGLQTSGITATGLAMMTEWAMVGKFWLLEGLPLFQAVATCLGPDGNWISGVIQTFWALAAKE